MPTKSILLVDDEEAIRETLSRFLRRKGFAVTTASTGEDALAAASRSAPDMVVSDLNMPGMGGVELIARIKRRFPEVMTIVLTGYASMESAVEMLHKGCDDYLLKPLPNMEVVAHAIARCSHRRRLVSLAESQRRVSQAKDNILELVVEEFASRLKEADACARALGAPGKASEADGQLKRLREVLSELSQTVEQARVVGQTVRDRVGADAGPAADGVG